MLHSLCWLILLLSLYLCETTELGSWCQGRHGDVPLTSRSRGNYHRNPCPPCYSVNQFPSSLRHQIDFKLADYLITMWCNTLFSWFLWQSTPFRHSCEGPDDMPAHIKACFMGSSLTIPISDGKLNLGTWQGIWLCEHRNRAGSRKIIVTINGCLKEGSWWFFFRSFFGSWTEDYTTLTSCSFSLWNYSISSCLPAIISPKSCWQHWPYDQTWETKEDNYKTLIAIRKYNRSLVNQTRIHVTLFTFHPSMQASW